VLRTAIPFKTNDILSNEKGLPPCQRKLESQPGRAVSVPAVLRFPIAFKTHDIPCGGKGLPPSPLRQSKLLKGWPRSLHAALRAGAEPRPTRGT
jgi:hypothetical protein